MKHNLHAYINRGCRCDVCRETYRAYRAKERARLRAETANGGSFNHGTVFAYEVRGCRCQTCRAEYRRAHPLKPRSEWLPKGPPITVPCPSEAAYLRGCRCDGCRRANRELHARTVAKMRRKGLAPGDPRHGTRGGYVNWGCRCDACRKVNAAAFAAYQKKRRAPGDVSALSSQVD